MDHSKIIFAYFLNVWGHIFLSIRQKTPCAKKIKTKDQK